MGDFEGKVVLVTGAGGGIGAVCARRFAEAGASVLLTDIAEDRVAVITQDIISAGGHARVVTADLTQDDSVERLMADALQSFGRLDVLCNNAADLADDMSLIHDRDVESTSMRVWERALRVNVQGTARCCQGALPLMAKSGGGAIVNMASNLGLQGNRVQVAYSASKAALIQLTRSIAASHGRRGVRCNAVAPGLVLTPKILKRLSAERLGAIRAETLTPTMPSPDDVADVVLFLASYKSRFVTGHVLVVDGGNSSHVPGLRLED